MLTERLEVLLTAEQRRRLDAEAWRKGTSGAALVRAAIDHRYGVVTTEHRRGAVEQIAAMDGRYADPAELERLIAMERDDVGRALGLDPPCARGQL